MKSKELLTEVLQHKEHFVKDIDFDVDDHKIGYLLSNDNWYFINIYELAYKCKEWAFTKGYSILSGKENRFYTIIIKIDKTDDIIKEFSFLEEPEAIFIASEWVYVYMNNLKQ